MDARQGRPPKPDPNKRQAQVCTCRLLYSFFCELSSFSQFKLVEYFGCVVFSVLPPIHIPPLELMCATHPNKGTGKNIKLSNDFFYISIHVSQSVCLHRVALSGGGCATFCWCLCTPKPEKGSGFVPRSAVNPP